MNRLGGGETLETELMVESLQKRIARKRDGVICGKNSNRLGDEETRNRVRGGETSETG